MGTRRSGGEGGPGGGGRQSAALAVVCWGRLEECQDLVSGANDLVMHDTSPSLICPLASSSADSSEFHHQFAAPKCSYISQSRRAAWSELGLMPLRAVDPRAAAVAASQRPRRRADGITELLLFLQPAGGAVLAVVELCMWRRGSPCQCGRPGRPPARCWQRSRRRHSGGCGCGQGCTGRWTEARVRRGHRR